MAKKRKAAVATAAAAGRGADRQLARLEKRLAGLEREEAKRSRQLDAVRSMQAELRAQISELRANTAAEPAPAAEVAPTDGPKAYCMREKRKVPIAGAELVVLGNGRQAYAGTCPDCGARVIAIVGAGVRG